MALPDSRLRGNDGREGSGENDVAAGGMMADRGVERMTLWRAG